MNKLKYVVAALVAVCTIFACTQNGKQDTVNDSDDSTNITVNDTLGEMTEINARIGDGTTMNYLELIASDGDTLSLLYGGANRIGKLLAGDVLNVVYYNNTDGEQAAFTYVNLTSLQHVWEKADGSGQSIEIDEGGKVVTYDMPDDCQYDSWKIVDGKLLLHTPKPIGKEVSERVDTMSIEFEDADDKVLLLNGEKWNLYN